MYYDGPLMVLVTLGEGHRVLGIMLDRGELKDSFMLVELTEDQEKRLLSNGVTLRNLYLECLAPGGLGAYYLDDINAPVWNLESVSTIAEDNLPGNVFLFCSTEQPDAGLQAS